MQLTHRIAHALGWHAPDEQMTRDGRTSWNEADAQLAATTLRQHFPLCQELAGIETNQRGCTKCTKGSLSALVDVPQPDRLA